MIRPLYKAQAPFMEVKRGYGYQGVVMYDDAEDKVQCHICGNWFENVGQHSAIAHQLKAEDYKLSFGLTLSTALCGRKKSKRDREIGLSRREHFNSVRNVWTKTHRPRRRKNYIPPHGSMRAKNRKGLCDLQIRSRYEVVKSIVGKDPSRDDFQKYDKQLESWFSRNGGLNKYKKSIGVKNWENGLRTPDIELIAALRKMAKEKKRVPYTTDFNKPGRPHFQTMLNHFGSWANTLRMAGLK